MSNLKNNFDSKLTSVIKTNTKKGFVYTASFEDGTTGVIRTSKREYSSVTQIGCDNSWGKVTPGSRSDFLFSSKVHPSLGKNEAHREIVTIKIQLPAPEPVVAEVKYQIYIERHDGLGLSLDGCWGSEHARFDNLKDAEESAEWLGTIYPDAEFVVCEEVD
jgi:hypothetical protein